MVLDDDHMACIPIFLQGTALTWFNNNVDGMNHQKDMWSFKMVMIRLYDRFLHNIAVGAVSDKFWSTNYAQDEGVMEFHHRLEHDVVRMVRPPDRYSFKKHYMLWLPKNIFDHLLQKEVTPGFSTMKSILHHVRKVEEITFQTS